MFPFKHFDNYALKLTDLFQLTYASHDSSRMPYEPVTIQYRTDCWGKKRAEVHLLKPGIFYCFVLVERRDTVLSV